jgi:hypothetical protein
MIVFPMAGLSRRFREAGYAVPKYMLALHGQTLFAHAVGGFRAYFDREPFLFVARDEPGIAAFLSRELDALGVVDARVVLLAHPTLGQADTVRLGLRQSAVDADVPLTIFNIDTFRPGFCYPDADWMSRADGYLEVMPGSDPGYSYVRPLPGDDSRAAETAEKRVISGLASTGLYWFRRAGDFLDAMRTDPSAAETLGELYIAPLYNALIASGRDVRFHLVAEKDVIFCGTPSQYHALLAPAA